MYRVNFTNDVDALWNVSVALSAESHAGNPYGLPHADLRPHQGETIEWLLTRQAGDTAIVQAPTGSGKTSFAAAPVSQGHQVAALVKTKNLQIENYGGVYAFDVLYGRGNYDCAHPAAPPRTTAEQCMYGSKMRECEVAGDCPYLVQKDRVQASKRRSLNYPYWLTAKWPRADLADKNGYLFCDEAHQLSDVVLDYVSATITMRQRLDWDLPAFPVVRGRPGPADVSTCLGWLEASTRRMQAQVKALRATLVSVSDDTDLEDMPPSDGNAPPVDAGDLRQLKAAQALLMKLNQVKEALETNATDWYLRSGPGARMVADNPEPAFVARPLTARFHFPGLFISGAWRTVLMSATIGDPRVLAEELGLERYDFRDIPNQWAPDQRPVYDLGAPKMGMKTKNDPVVQMEHARVIAEAIQDCPRTWAGLILVTSKSEAWALSKRLATFGLERRLHVPDTRHGTELALRAWNQFRDRTPGALCVTWNFWEGYNGLHEKIVIVAKTPFPSLGDEYERERMVYSNAFWRQRTAWQLEQGLGRTRRGRPEDYDGGGVRRGLVAIADGNYDLVKNSFSSSLRAAIRPW